jgi:hypothetical protein
LGVAGRGRWNWIRGHPLAELELAQRGVDDAAARLGRDDQLWPGQLSILATLVLYLLLPPKLTIGPNWLLPSAEGILLAGLVYAARRHAPQRRRRMVALGLLFAVTVANMVALGLLVHYLIVGGHAKGADLLGGGVVIWLTNLALFTVWYWEVDRGGPLPPEEGQIPEGPEFLFPQMTDAKEFAPRGWRPGYLDYLYVSLTNQTAFSPTDTMPLSIRAKILMSVQATASLVTVGIIVARAVNILA